MAIYVTVSTMEQRVKTRKPLPVKRRISPAVMAKEIAADWDFLAVVQVAVNNVVMVS